MINLKVASLMILLALFMLPLFAQERPGEGHGQGQGHGQWGGQMSEENVKQRVDNLAETLECTDQQKEKILAYELDWYRKMQTERQKMMDGGGDREAMQAKMQEQRKLKDEKYAEVLTEAQMKKYNQLMEERMQQRQAQRQGQEQGQGDGQNSQRQRGRGQN